jgi:hypothetical protein
MAHKFNWQLLLCPAADQTQALSRHSRQWAISGVHPHVSCGLL